MSTQNNNQDPKENKTTEELRTQGQEAQGRQAQELNETDQKEVSGGSGLLSGGNDLTNIIAGTATLTNQSSGSNGDESYTSNDSHSLDLGLGNVLNNTNF